MLRNLFRFAGYLAPIALVAFMSMPQAFAQKTTVVSAVSTPLSLSLTADSNIITACADGGAPQVKLTANAVSPGGYPTKTKWRTDAGMIIRDGPIVAWKMAGLTPGYHKASIDIVSVGSDASCLAFSAVSVLVIPCFAVQAVWPAIEISWPTDVA